MSKLFMRLRRGFDLAKYMKSVDPSVFFDKHNKDVTDVDKSFYLT